MSVLECPKPKSHDATVPARYAIDDHIVVQLPNRLDHALEVWVPLIPGSARPGRLPVDAAVETFEDTGHVFLANAAHATTIPGLDLSGLTPEQKEAALQRLNADTCTCGCGLTLAQCRINDTSCGVSLPLAKQVVDEIVRGAT